MYKIDAPKNVNFIIKLLEKAGYEAFIVGGCVRDVLMGRNPEDWDITTSAKPENVKKIFHKTIDTGIKHGTVTVMMERVGYEVTTYRIDGDYTDGRHPDSVEFTTNLVEDLKRRDFTINAMAYNPTSGIVDEFGGIEDLDNKVIRCVGNPVERFTEDALRMLRAVRFAAKLGFTIDHKTKDAIKNMAHTITKVSKERIKTELDKLITSDNPHILKEIYRVGLDKYILEKSVLVSGNADVSPMYDTIIKVMENTSNDLALRWAAFMMYEGDNCNSVLRALKFDNKTINICRKLVENINEPADYGIAKEKDLHNKKYLIRKLMVKLTIPVFMDYYIPFLKALKKSGVEFKQDINENDILEMEQIAEEILKSNDCLSTSDMLVKGADLKAAGIMPGKEMGEIIGTLFEEVLKDPKKNNKETLLEIVSHIKG